MKTRQVCSVKVYMQAHMKDREQMLPIFSDAMMDASIA